MGLFDYHGLSTATVSAAARIANAAYADQPLPGLGWIPLTASNLNFISGPASGSFNGIYYNAGLQWFGGIASATIFQNGDTIAISFRGTNNAADYLTYPDIIGNNNYINAFTPLLDSVAAYITNPANSIHHILVTGHSLGAAAADILRDVSGTIDGGIFATADYVTFATPKVATNSDILNIGFEDDGVFKSIARINPFSPNDFASTTDNIVYYDDAYADPAWPGLTFDPISDHSVHSMSFYIDAIARIQSSTFYSGMSRDSVVVLVATNELVQDRNVSTSNHFNQPTYYIGRDGQSDNIRGGASTDDFEGFGGNDKFEGKGGNDSLIGGLGDDVGVFSGDCDDYTITHNADGSVWTITDKVAGRDGTDTLTGMEYVQFANEIHRLELGHSICGGGEDLCLVIDTTSSMSDDIAAVKAQAINLIRQIFESGEDAAASRISIVGFKDPGETQVILSFTNQMSLADREAAAIAAINSISVSGGGDIPEGAYSALLVALNGSAGAWREDANVRRIVLFTDAPAKDGSLAAQVNALAQNVVIVHASDGEPAASSGLAAAAGAVPINAGVEIYGVVVGSDASALASVTQIANDNRGLVFQAGAAGDVAGSIADAVTTPYLIAANGTAGNDTLTGTIVGDRIVGLDGNDTIHGLDGDDYLVGGTGNDTLFGEAGSDRLDGSEGTDTMVGGAGNDTYIVDNVADVVTELANEGTDTVKSYIAWALQANFENLELLGTNAISGFGNAQNNVITGNSGSNFESGGGGSDTLYGKDGDDTLVGDTPAGTISDAGGNGNNAIATALQITAFTLAADANIQNSTSQPHATIAGTGDNTYRFYSLAITRPGVSAVFDIDFPQGLSSGSFDSHLRLYNSAGVLLAENDDAATSLGGNGSTSGLDSYLQYTFAAAGTYYIELARHSHEVIPAAANYQLQVSISDIGGVTGSLVAAAGASDILDGGSGRDVLTGGGGDDRFVFAPGYAADTITDFSAGTKTDDKIDLTAFHTTLASALGRATQSGADTVFNFGNGDTLTLQNVNKASLNADDFVGAPNKTPGDFGGDAKSDLLFINNTSHGIAEWQMDGAQLLTGPQIGTINAAGGWRFNNTGDFDGDGRNDLMFLNDVTHGVAVWTMDGTRVTASPQIGTINAAGGWGYTGTGDFNGDGKTDLLFLNSTTHGVAIWQLDGTKVTAAPQIGTINAAGGWSYTGTGDFNGDGKTDLLFLNPTTHGVAIWQMDGTKITAAPQIGTINAAGGWSYTGSGDFNGDGKTDLLFLNATTRGVAIWQLNGTQITASSQVGTSAAGWHFQDTGDFDGDGKADLLWINDSTHDATVWLMNGNQIATNRSIGTINAAAGWHYDGLRDFNGDAKTDLLFENSTTHGLAVWLMNGTQVTANSQIGVVNAAADWHLTL